MVVRSYNAGTVVGYAAYNWVNSGGSGAVDFAFNSPLIKGGANVIYNPWFIDLPLGNYVTWVTLCNPGDTAVDADIYWYSTAGALLATTEVNLKPHQSTSKRPSTLISDTKGAMVVECRDASTKIIGYVTRFWKNTVDPAIYDFGFSDQFSLTPGSQTLYIPHAIENPLATHDFRGYLTNWNTSVGEASPLTYEFHLLDGTPDTTNTALSLNPGVSFSKRPTAHLGASNETNMTLSTTAGSLLGYHLEFDINYVDTGINDYSTCADMMMQPEMVMYCPRFMDNVAPPAADFTGTYRTDMYLYNPSGANVNADLIYYTEDGTASTTVNVDIAAYNTYKFRPSDHVAYGTGSLKVSVVSGAGLTGQTSRSIVNASDPAITDAAIAEEFLTP
jgi:hypothetical protein